MVQAAELADKGAKELQAGNDKSLKDVQNISSGHKGVHSKDTPPRDKSSDNCDCCSSEHSQLICHLKSSFLSQESSYCQGLQ